MVLDRLVKKETVTGIIGNTHGVINAIKPPSSPKINTDHPLAFLLSLAASPQAPAGAVVAVAGNCILKPSAFFPFAKNKYTGTSC